MSDIGLMKWLASGRNACPLCRGVGVATKESKQTDTPSTSLQTGEELGLGVEASVETIIR